ncbi:MAG: ATP-binding cassette domain-containing protein [Pirellulaceae bacterium]
MSSVVLAPSPSAPDAASCHIESLVWIYEQMGFTSNHSFSRSMIRDALEQSVTALTDDDMLAWHVWLDEAFQGLGLRCRVIDAPVEQVRELVASGTQLVLRHDDGSWLAVGGADRGRVLVLRPTHESRSSWQSRTEFCQTLSEAQSGGLIRCVAVTPGLSVPASEGTTVLEPLQRVVALLRPEWPDIWIVIVFALVIGLLALATPIAVETLVNTVAFGRLLQPVVILSLMLLVVLAFSGALRALQTYVVEIIQRRLFVRVAADIAYRLPRVRADALQGHAARELVNRFFDIVTVQKVAAQLLLDGVSLLLGTVIGMAMLAFYHPWLLGFDVILLGMIGLIVFVLGRGAVKTSIEESKTKYRMAAWLEDLASCPTAFRHDGAARFALERADHLAFDYLEARSSHFHILMRQIVFALGMQALASTVLLGLGGWLVISGQLTLGQLVAAELIVAVIVGSFAKLGKHMESFYDLLASVDKLGALFDLPLEPQSGLVALPVEGCDQVEIQEIHCHNASGRKVLNDLSLTIHPGDRVALTGPSGSGKSTLLDLLFGLRAPTAGQVTLKGVEVREVRPELLRRYVSLLRDVEVFEGSIIDNVRVGRTHVSTAEARQALADVGLLEELFRLPEQLDTQLISTGHPLSSTQLRRLMLARACVGGPRLLLIDRVLDLLPDCEAIDMLTWLCRPEHPWKIVLITGREELAAICNRRWELPGPSIPSKTRPESMGESRHE